MLQNIKKQEQQLDNSRITTAAVFAFLPPFGIFGVHNFIVRQYSRGILHIIITACAFLSPIMANSTCPYYSSACRQMWVMPAQNFCLIILIASFIWAIVEGVKLLQSCRPPDASSTTWAILTYNKTPQAETSTNNTQVATKTKITQTEKRNSKAWSILSFIFAIIPILVWVYCFIIVNTNANKNMPDVSWLFIIFYYCTVGVPLCIMSIAFGFVGLKTSLRKLAIATLIVKIITIAVIFSIFFISLIH